MWHVTIQDMHNVRLWDYVQTARKKASFLYYDSLMFLKNYLPGLANSVLVMMFMDKLVYMRAYMHIWVFK